MSSIEKVIDNEKDIRNKMMKSKIKSMIKNEAGSSLDIKLSASEDYQSSSQMFKALYDCIFEELDDRQKTLFLRLLQEHDAVVDSVKRNCVDLISYL